MLVVKSAGGGRSREDRMRTEGEICLFYSWNSKWHLHWLDEKVPHPSLAAIILHPIHSSSLF